MEAANKGAAHDGGKSVGLNIELPHEQSGNRFANVPIHFHYFFCAQSLLREIQPRLHLSCPAASARSTNFLKSLTLVQTQRIPQFPLILFGSEHWNGLIALDENANWKKTNSSAPATSTSSKVTDDVDEVIEIIRDYERRVGPPATLPKAFA